MTRVRKEKAFIFLFKSLCEVPIDRQMVSIFTLSHNGNASASSHFEPVIRQFSDSVIRRLGDLAIGRSKTGTNDSRLIYFGILFLEAPTHTRTHTRTRETLCMRVAFVIVAHLFRIDRSKFQDALFE